LFQGEKVKVTFELLKNYVWFAAGQTKPSDDVLQQKQKPIGKLLEEISEMKESKRNTPHFNHLSAIAEGIGAVGWVNVVSFIKRNHVPMIIHTFLGSNSGPVCERDVGRVNVLCESSSRREQVESAAC
jgi:hypothetical protein